MDSTRSTGRPGEGEATATGPDLSVPLDFSGCIVEIGRTRQEAGWPERRPSRGPRWEMEVRAPESVLPRTKAAAAAKSLQSCPTLCDPIDGSPPGSTVPGILQARTLEWVAISFSNS